MMNALDDDDLDQDPHAGDDPNQDAQRVQFVPMKRVHAHVSQQLRRDFAFHTGEDAIHTAARRAAMQRADEFLGSGAGARIHGVGGGDDDDENNAALMQPPAARRGAPRVESIHSEEEDDSDAAFIFRSTYGVNAPPRAAPSTQAAPSEPPAQTPEFDAQCTHCIYATHHNDVMFKPLAVLYAFVKKACYMMDFDMVFEEADKYYKTHMWQRAWREHGKILPRMSAAGHCEHFLRHLACDLDIQLAHDIRKYSTLKAMMSDKIYRDTNGEVEPDLTRIAAMRTIDDMHYKRLQQAEARSNAARRSKSKGGQ